MDEQEGPLEGAQLAVNKLHFWAALCPAGEHPAHPGETCEDIESALEQLRGRLLNQAVASSELVAKLGAAEAALARVRAQCERWKYTADRKRAAEEMLQELEGGA